MESVDLPDVRMVIAPDDLQRVGRFHYGIYIREQGKAARHVDHEARTLIEPADASVPSCVPWIERRVISRSTPADPSGVPV